MTRDRAEARYQQFRAEARDRRDDLLAEGAGRLAELAGVATALVRNVGHHVQSLVEDVSDDSLEVAREAEELLESARGRLDDALERFDEARDAVRAAPRVTRVVSEGLALVARHRLGNALEAARSELTGRPVRVSEARHAHTARRLRILCEELRGGILKLGQFVSTRRDLLPEVYGEELAKLQDRVPPVPASEAVTRLVDALGPDWGRHFASFEPVPLAAASLAQVHGAALTDGTPVAVKLLVPGIEGLVEADLAALRVLAPNVRELFHRIDLDTLTDQLSSGLRRELDLGAEADAAQELGAAFANDPDVIVPRIHREASGPGVLVMERIEGERLLDFLDGCAARGEAGVRDRDRLFTILVRCFCEQVLVHGLFQADPHPGNFLVVPGPEGPRLALLDFGCIERYDAETRSHYAALALAILARDETRMIEMFEKIGFRSRDGRPEGLRAYAELFLAAFRDGASLEGEDHAERIAQILELTDTDPIAEIPGHFVMLGRVFASLGGLLVSYRPSLDLGSLLRPSLLGAMQPGPAGPPGA